MYSYIVVDSEIFTEEWRNAIDVDVPIVAEKTTDVACKYQEDSKENSILKKTFTSNNKENMDIYRIYDEMWSIEFNITIIIVNSTQI